MGRKYELEACPHCGGPGAVKDIPKPYRHGWVGCPGCGVIIGWNNTPDSAVARWNRRVGSGDAATVALTAAAVSLIKYMPEAVNALAARLGEKLDELVLYGYGGDEQ